MQLKKKNVEKHREKDFQLLCFIENEERKDMSLSRDSLLAEDALRLWFWDPSCLKAVTLLCLTEEESTPVPWDCFRTVIDLCVPNLKLCMLRHRLGLSDGCLLEVTTLCPSVTTLNVSGGDLITDAGIGTLATLSSLQHLNVSCCKLITDAGIGTLTALSSLQYLDVSWCNLITDSCVDRLRAALPHLFIMT